MGSKVYLQGFCFLGVRIQGRGFRVRGFGVRVKFRDL